MKIGEFDTDKRVFVIAEAGVNHGGNLNFAGQLIEEAVEAGADAVKFQCFDADRFPEPQRSICKPLQLSHEYLEVLHEYATDLRILWLCTPFDKDAVDFLAPLVPAFKIGSGQARDKAFVDYIVDIGKPTIISTGMGGPYCSAENVALLHCRSIYPCPPESANLLRMVQLGMHGYSDHTGTIEIPVAAVALGARIIECHLTLDRNAEGSDHTSSLEPAQFKEMVRMIRNVEKAIC